MSLHPKDEPPPDSRELVRTLRDMDEQRWRATFGARVSSYNPHNLFVEAPIEPAGWHPPLALPEEPSRSEMKRQAIARGEDLDDPEVRRRIYGPEEP